MDNNTMGFGKKVIYIIKETTTIFTTIFTLISGIVLTISPTGDEAYKDMLMELPKIGLIFVLFAISLLGLFSLIYPRVVDRKKWIGKIVNDVKKPNTPHIEISIDSNDIRHMNSNQITHFFRGIKQSLIEYRKALKETHKYEQETAKKQSAKERKTEKQ